MHAHAVNGRVLLAQTVPIRTFSMIDTSAFPFVFDMVFWFYMRSSFLVVVIFTNYHRYPKQGGAKGSMCEPFSLLADVCGPSEGEHLSDMTEQRLG